MTPTKFRKLSLEYFGGFLFDLGFEVQTKYGPTYFKANENDVYHFIMPQTNRRGDWFDVMIFANSPKINPKFEAYFENGIDVPSDNNSYLHPVEGIHWRQKCYKCGREEDFINSFNKEVLPALQTFALPYLEKINTVSDLVKTVHSHVAHNYNLDH